MTSYKRSENIRKKELQLLETLRNIIINNVDTEVNMSSDNELIKRAAMWKSNNSNEFIKQDIIKSGLKAMGKDIIN